eukprot:evm.model.scf_1224.4 EVM.evm.TU.scf_1224.4   scf_1224:35651-37802(+)
MALTRRGVCEVLIGAGLAGQARRLAWAPPALARQERPNPGGADGSGPANAPRFGPAVKARKSAPKYKTVLSLDGGGTRGVISTKVLERVEEKIKDNIRRNGLAEGDFEVDLASYFVTKGGLSQAWLSSDGEFVEYDRKSGMPPLRAGSARALEMIFRLKADEIFPASPLGPLANLSAVLNPKYGLEGLNYVMGRVLGDLTLGDAQTSVLMPTFELETSRPVDFWADCSGGEATKTGYTAIRIRQLGDKGGEWEPDRLFKSGNDFSIKEVAVASAAFPSLYPASPIRYPDGTTRNYSDGGLISSNPTTSALSYMQIQRQVPLSKLAVLSLGCGVVLPNRISVKDKGILGWLNEGQMIPLFLDQKSEYMQSIVDGLFYKVLNATPGQYTRIQIAVDQDNKFFDEDRMGALSSADDFREMDDLAMIGGELADVSDAAIARFVDDFVMA